MPGFASADVLVRADALARRYGQRPSTLLGVTDPLLAWQVDEAAALAGNAAERLAAPPTPRTPAPAPARVLRVDGQPLLVGTFVREE